MTVVLPQAADYPIVDLDDEDWRKVEEALGAPLDNRWRGRINETINNYVVAVYFATEEKAKRQMLGTVRNDGTVKYSERALEMLRDMDALVRSWSIAQREAPSIFAKYDATLILDPGQRNLQDVIGDVQHHRIALRNWLDRGWKHKRSVKPKPPPFPRFVKALAGIYRGVRGTEPTNAVTLKSGGADERASAFTEFVRCLDSLLPATVQR